MSTLSLEPAVSLFEPAAPKVAPTAAVAPALPRRSRRARPHAAHARRAAGTSEPGIAALSQLAWPIAGRTLGISAAAAVVTWALAAKSTGGASDVAMLSLRGLAVAAVICAAWGFQDRQRLAAMETTRTWYGVALVLALAHIAWFAATLPGYWQDRLGLTAGVFTLDVVLVVVPALLGARAGRPEARTA
jgi:hypothetical protein